MAGSGYQGGECSPNMDNPVGSVGRSLGRGTEKLSNLSVGGSALRNNVIFVSDGAVEPFRLENTWHAAGGHPGSKDTCGRVAVVGGARPGMGLACALTAFLAVIVVSLVERIIRRREKALAFEIWSARINDLRQLLVVLSLAL